MKIFLATGTQLLSQTYLQFLLLARSDACIRIPRGTTRYISGFVQNFTAFGTDCPSQQPDFKTIQAHGGQPDLRNGARAVPLFQTCSYNFMDTADGASKFAWAKDGYVYTRMANPTLSIFENRMPILEGCVRAVVTASGRAAQVCKQYSLSITRVLKTNWNTFAVSWPSHPSWKQATTLSARAGYTEGFTSRSSAKA